MYITQELADALVQERQRGIAHQAIARHARCRRACCNPTRLDRIAGRLGLDQCARGAAR